MHLKVEYPTDYRFLCMKKNPNEKKKKKRFPKLEDELNNKYCYV